MMEMTIRIKDIISPAFYGVHHKIKKHTHTHYWFPGGRGSTKSSFISLEIILGMMKNPQANAICFRKIGFYLKDSVYEQLLWAIDTLGVRDSWEIGISPLKLTYRQTGQVILFRGVDDPQKSKSIKCSNGYFAYIWYEELDEFECMEEVETINRSLLRGGSRFWVFYSYNPPKSKNNWVNHEVTVPFASKFVKHSTYLSIPPKWLGETFIVEAEHLKSRNYDRYRHVYLGEAIGTGGEVFSNVTLREISNDEIRRFDNLRRGLDFGYAGDPLAYNTMHYNKTRRRIFIFYEFYKLGVSNRLLAAEIKKENTRNERVTCDNAHKDIDDLYLNYSINAFSAEKGPGSREHGMKWLSEEIEEIIIDPVRCPNTAREFVGYELEQDKFGNFKGKYPDGDDHSIDATRYAMEDEMRAALKLKSGRHNIF